MTSNELTHEGKEAMTILENRKYQVPVEWAMFTAAGNRAIETLAAELVKRLAEIHAHDFGADYYVEGKGPRSAEKRAYRDFFRAYKSLAEQDGFREAGDTAVREEVWCFALHAASYTQHVDADEMDAVWNGTDSVCKELAS